MKIHSPFNINPKSPRRTFSWTVSLVAVFFAAGAIQGCSEKSEGPADDAGTHEPAFFSTVTGYGLTRAADAQWYEDDEIGIFAFESGKAPGAASELAANRRYVTDGSGNFTAVSTADRIFLSDGEKTDFIAYYPYQADVSGYIYPIDLTEQSYQEDLDLLYSNNVKHLDAGNSTAFLSFSHQLTKIVFNVTTTGEGGLGSLEVTGRGMKTKASFDLLTGGLTADPASVEDFRLALKTTVEGRSAEAMVLPTTDVSGIKFIFTLGEEVFTWDYPSDKELEKGKKYTYSVKLNSAAPPVVGEEYIPVEFPIVQEIENTILITHDLPAPRKGRNHTLLYDTYHKIAYWVAYPLNSGYMGGAERSNKWAYDPKVPRTDQMNCIQYSYLPSDMDKGHQLPSADRTHSDAENYTTFYMTNITPQNNTLNQQAWERLEEVVRIWSRQTDTLFVVTGAMLPENNADIEWIPDRSGNVAAKPAYYYKALAKKVGEAYYTISYKFDNVPEWKTANYDNYKYSVKELEEMTGMTFFPTIPDEAKSTIETSQWIWPY